MIERKRTYKDITDPQILQIWQEVKDEARSLYPYYFDFCEPELYWDSSYSHLGRCRTTIMNPSEKNIDKMKHERCIILVSTNLGTDYYQIRRTLCHELGHFVAPYEHHSYLWKARADKIGKRWGLEATRTTANETFQANAAQERAKRSATDYKYRVFCPHCNAEWKYKSNCKIVQYSDLYRCGKCKINLESEKI